MKTVYKTILTIVFTSLLMLSLFAVTPQKAAAYQPAARFIVLSADSDVIVTPQGGDAAADDYFGLYLPVYQQLGYNHEPWHWTGSGFAPPIN